MKSIAGGTLIADAEADYWLQKIKLMNYRPIWRWHYGKALTEWGTQAEAEIKKRKEHAEMINKLEKDRNDKLNAEGKPVPEADLAGLEDELRAKLGF